MRACALAFAILLVPAEASAADISAACYSDCEARTTSNPEYKACLARAADAADAELNQVYTALKAAIRRFAKEMGQQPDIQLQSLVDAQKKWIAYRDANCTFEDQLAFGGSSIGGNYSTCLCALSLERAQDFARIAEHVIHID
jgi:uncharacterized protein YecT (DUF1311 family)